MVRPRSQPTPHPWARRAATGLYARLAHRRIRPALPEGFTLFSMVTRPVVDAYLQREERFHLYMIVIAELGMPVVALDYEKAERPAGQSAYTPFRLMRLAFRVLSPVRGRLRTRPPEAIEWIPGSFDPEATSG